MNGRLLASSDYRHHYFALLISYCICGPKYEFVLVFVRQESYSLRRIGNVRWPFKISLTVNEFVLMTVNH